MQSNAAGHRSSQLDLADFQKRIESGKNSVALLFGEVIQIPGEHNLDQLLSLTRKQFLYVNFRLVRGRSARLFAGFFSCNSPNELLERVQIRVTKIYPMKICQRPWQTRRRFG